MYGGPYAQFYKAARKRGAVSRDFFDGVPRFVIDDRDATLTEQADIYIGSHTRKALMTRDRAMIILKSALNNLA